MATDHISKISAKIAKLLALAERAGTPEEAKSASEKAERLIVQYGIEQAMINAHRTDDVKPEEIIRKYYPADLKGYGRLQLLMMHDVALGLGLKGFRTGWSGYHVVGHESDVEAYEILAKSVVLQAMNSMTQWWKVQRYYHTTSTPHEKRTARVEYLRGFSSACMSRLLEMHREVVAHTPGSGLVLVDRKKAVDDYMSGMKLQKPRASTAQTNYSSRMAGNMAGREANLGEKSLSGTRALG